MRLWTACSLMGWCLVMSPLLEGATITVTTTIDELNETSPDGSCSLREALYSANHNSFPAGDCTTGSASATDVIVLAATTYTFGGLGSTTHGSGEELGRTGDLDILESVTIQGQGVTTTLIDAGGGDRIFDIDPAGAAGITATISDLTVQNGSAMSGGAIYNTGTLTLTNVTVSSSDSLSGTENGGGIKNAPGAVLDMTGGELKSNRSFNFGGGLYNNGGTATLTNVTIHSNTADQSGGGIYNTGTLTITGSDCHTNTSSASGGCLFNTSAGGANAVTIEKTVIRNNTASNNNGTGGGIRNEATMTLKNVTVSGNSALRGGGFYHFSGTATLRNVTLASNSVTSRGGGVRITGGTVNAYNTLIGDNTITAGTEDSHDCLGTLTSKGYNLVENTSGCTLSDDTTGNITGQDPALSALVNGTHALPATSPAVDAGNPSTPGSTDASCETTDQDGVTRPQGAACDIGAYEREQAANDGGGDSGDDDSGGDTGDDDDSGDGGDDNDDGDDDGSGDPTGGAGGTGDDDDDDGISTHGQGGTIDCARNLDRADQRKDGAPSLMLAGMTLALLAFRRRFPPP